MRIAKFITAFCALGVALTIAWATYQVAATPPPPPRPMAPYFPAGSLLYVEARDFQSVVKQWNGSEEKRAWLGSENYAEFSRSKLFQRLGEAQKEFAAAAGVSPDMPFLQQVAGNESAVAVYEIGKLQFLYVTRIPTASVAGSALWQTRGKYETRSVAGMTYYVHTNSTSGRTVAFGATSDYLVLATREDLIAGALALIAGEQQRKLADEPWYDRSIKAAHEPGDLRMVLNLEKVLPSPHFRSYWVQRNVAELKQYVACISDLRFSHPEFTEERVLLRRESQPPVQHSNLADVLRLVPEDTGFYRAWSDPDAGFATAQLQELLSPSPAQPPASDYAPPAPMAAANAGSEGDLERRIDQPPLVTQSKGSGALRNLLAAAHVSALLQVAASQPLPDGVFIGHAKALVLASTADWDAAVFRAAVQQQLAPHWTTSELGFGWVEESRGSIKLFRLDGLASFAVATSGHYLVIGNDLATVGAILGRINIPASQLEATYAAGFFHTREQTPFLRASSIMDRARSQSSQPGAVASSDSRRPAFFSGNIGSLSKTLNAVESETLLSYDSGAQVNQTVRYRWTK